MVGWLAREFAHSSSLHNSSPFDGCHAADVRADVVGMTRQLHLLREGGRGGGQKSTGCHDIIPLTLNRANRLRIHLLELTGRLKKTAWETPLATKREELPIFRISFKEGAVEADTLPRTKR